MLKNILFCLVFSSNLVLANEFNLEKSASIKLFDAYLKEIERLDGDGLLPRYNRKLTYKKVADVLRKDLVNSKNKMEVGRVFSRLDAAYTNLHAHIKLASEYDFNIEGRITLGAGFQPELIGEDGVVKRYLLDGIRKEYFVHLEPEVRPKKGDELLAINGVSLKKWSDENFEYCKFPLRSQCEYGFFGNFRSEKLSWFRRKPLVYTIKSNKKIFKVVIPVFVRSNNSNGNKSSSEEKLEPCGKEPEKYPNFELVYQGYHACVYELKNRKDVSLLRIRSFNYKKEVTLNDIGNVSQEVERFAKKYWDDRRKDIKNLIIDVIENGGGDIVTDWSAQFLDQPFQDQWVQFKKTKELDSDIWRANAFYEDPAKEKIYQNLKKSDNWLKLKTGDFISTMPQFCYSDDGDCLKEKFLSIKDKYKGNILIMTDPWCISSCVGFIWTLKQYLKERVKILGLPDSGDSTYSRSYLEGKVLKNKNFELSVFPRPPQSKAQVSEGAMFRSAISTSRSTDEFGEVISGRPQKVDYFISPKWDDYPELWVSRVLDKSVQLAK